MIVTAVASGDATMPEGFARETLQCAACGDIEQRFVFGGASSKRDELESASAPRAAISSSAPADATSPLLPLPLRYSSLSSVPSPGRAPAQVGPSAPAWTRAVEKLRNRQAYIGVRPDQQQSDWNARISQALEKLVPRGHRRRAAGNAAPHGIGAVGGGLREASFARATQTTIEPSPDAIQQFNQFWDGLLMDRPAAPAEACPASTERRFDASNCAPPRSQKEAE
jgi:hypothetical protein